MKKLIVILTTIIYGQLAAQTLYSNGANITINGALVQVNGTLLNKGKLDLKQTSQMIVKGNIDNQGKLSNDGHIDLYGNIWSTTKIDNPVFGIWSFNGSTAQEITSDSSFTAKDMIFSNPNGFKISVANDLKVTNTTNFVRGILEMLNSTKMRYGSSASHSNSSDTSHVKGIVAKEGTGSFNYPVGTGTKLQHVSINASTNPTDIRVGYNAADAGSALFGITGAQATPLRSYNTSEYWQMSSGGAQGTVIMTQDATNALTIPDLADVRVGRKTGSQWLNQGGSATGTVTSATIESLNSTLDGEFTLGIVKKDISVAVINPSGKTSICNKDTLTIIARRVLGLNEFSTSTTFSVSPASSSFKVNDTTFMLFPNATTQFELTGIDQNNLVGTVNFNLVVNQLPSVTASIKNPIIVNGVPLNNWPKDNSIELVATGATSYSWSPNTFVNVGINSNNLIATPASHITYNVVGTDVNGCKNTASVNVRTFVVKTENLSSCTSINWRGRTITFTGSFGDTLTVPNVDTIFVLNFTSNAVQTGIVFENGRLASQCMDCQYQWYACNDNGTYTPIENATSRILQTTTKGNYSVETSNGKCTAKSKCLFNGPTSGIASTNDFKGITVFPNPFVDKLNVILSSDPVNAAIQIVDINGRVVTSYKVNKSTEATLNLTSIASGTYFIQIVFDREFDKLYYTKIIKE
jgi:hypothetical protein